MFKLCDKCKVKPAVTKCINGQLCVKCGSNCHQDLSHPTTFLIHYDIGEGLENRMMSVSTLASAGQAKPLLKRKTKSKQIIKKSQSLNTLNPGQTKTKNLNAKVEEKLKSSSVKKKVFNYRSSTSENMGIQTDRTDQNQTVEILRKELDEKNKYIIKLQKKMQLMKKQTKQQAQLYRDKLQLMQKISKR